MPEQFTPERADQLPGPDEILSMSGLEFMQKVLAGELPMAPIGAALNYRLQSVAAAEVIFRGTPGFDHMNPSGTIHGGWYGTLLDSAMACAVMTCVPKGSVYTTLEYKVNIIRPIPSGVTVDAIGTVEHAGRSTGVATGRIVGVEDGKLYATGSTTCIIMTPK
ncbi:PaaI family thioesterase [Litoreibacter arenae]|uniref:Thioesterase family protein n=1 Tax=Litoreibacter arenae DSM 19593 TaxID=1123360 RepID=S9QHB7_9RHOB|nr:PaaI family thioesterase [Litoreibacter arenae]EPX80861.1 Thioesterase family protein [Litoreibacter arenae DSM 19593]